MSVREHKSKATSQEHGVEPEVSRVDPRFKYFLLNVTPKVVQLFFGGERGDTGQDSCYLRISRTIKCLLRNEDREIGKINKIEAKLKDAHCTPLLGNQESKNPESATQETSEATKDSNHHTSLGVAWHAWMTGDNKKSLVWAIVSGI